MNHDPGMMGPITYLVVAHVAPQFLHSPLATQEITHPQRSRRLGYDESIPIGMCF